MATPQQIADKWAQRLGASVQEIARGVDAVTESPTAKAARRVDAYAAGVQRAVSDGRYVDGLNRVSLEEWKRSFKEKGLNRISTGAAAAKPKFERFMNAFLPHVNSVAERVRQMPKGTVADGIARAIAQIEGNAQFRFRG